MSHEAPASEGADAAIWRRSSYSGGQGDCLEVADGCPALVPVRDSKRPAGPVIRFGPDAWRAFVAYLG
ncbi:DUF397 domain-containing protein [Streptomyces sp. NPDC007264]|uniref:DUF397 domain-containing protein n=1 Tax=Streptomyces sp. NPDC007264 TaxID=3364777 RepID=UPI0036DC68AC